DYNCCSYTASSTWVF
nr:immunoglobulin light chain junction region [Macaca mulatta]